jgi:hypothetical protein
MRRQKLKRILFWTAVLLALLLLALLGFVLRATAALSAAARSVVQPAA